MAKDAQRLDPAPIVLGALGKAIVHRVTQLRGPTARQWW